MLNKIIIQGRMVNDAVLRTTNSGSSCTSFTVACERNRKDASGERPTDFLDCVAWRTTADFVSKYFHKGDSIVVEGNLYIRKFVDKDGNNRRTAEINVNDVYFPGSSKKGGNFTELSDGGSNPFTDESGDDDFPF